MIRYGAILMLAASLAALPAPGEAAPPIGMLTIVEGEVAVIRHAVKFAAAEGLRLQADDIIHTGDNARLARVEFAEGGALDLGPATRLVLRPRFAEPHLWRPSHLYVSQGWVKLTAGPAGKIGLSSPRFDLTNLAGVALARVGENDSFLFIESGTAMLIERAGGWLPRLRALKEGEAFDRRGGDTGSVISRPAPDMLKSIPRPFVDSLPPRAQRFQDVQVEPKWPTEISYADVSGWINAEPSLRPAFVQRWAGKARDPRFRAGLVADLRSHPEWGRVLFPNKTLARRKAPTAVAAAPPAAVGSAAVKLASWPAAEAPLALVVTRAGSMVEVAEPKP